MVIDPLAVDLYPNDFNGEPNIQAFVDAGPPWHVLTFKATEGLYYPGRDRKRRAWFLKHWLPARIFMGDRYGLDLFRQAYHYLRIDQDPVLQAEYLFRFVTEAGGFGPGDLPLMVDIESAENPENVSTQEIVDCGSKFSARLLAIYGRRPILYGGSYLRDHGVTDHMGCSDLWVAEYDAFLNPSTYQKMGWAHPFAWQYEGTEGPSGPKGYPRISPVGAGAADISAIIVNGGGQNALDYIRAM